MFYFDSFLLLVCETYNPNMSSEYRCWCFTLNTFFFSKCSVLSKTLVYFQLKSLETHPKQAEARSYPSQKYRFEKRRKGRRIKRGNMLAKISCVCESGQNVWNGNWDLHWQFKSVMLIYYLADVGVCCQSHQCLP